MEAQHEQKPKTAAEIRQIVSECVFDDGAPYYFHVRSDRNGDLFLQAHYIDTCVINGTPERQWTRKWKLSPYMTQSEIVQTVFLLCKTSMEHRLRERFKWRDRRVFGPHFDVQALWEICDRLDVRA